MSELAITQTPVSHRAPLSGQRGVALTILSGVVVFLTGASIGASLGAWGVEGEELLRIVADSRGEWRAANVLVAGGTAAAAAGMAGFALLLWCAYRPARGQVRLQCSCCSRALSE